MDLPQDVSYPWRAVFDAGLARGDFIRHPGKSRDPFWSRHADLSRKPLWAPAFAGM